MSDIADQIDALLALNAKGAVSHPVPGLAVELLTKAADALRSPSAREPSSVQKMHESPPAPVVTDEMVDQAVAAFEEEMGSDRPSVRIIEAALTAALQKQEGGE